MAKISGEKDCGSAVNQDCMVGISLTSCTRSVGSDNITVKFKIYVYTDGYTSNSICAWYDGTKYTIFNSNNGANKTTSGTKYYSSTITDTIACTGTSTTLKVGINGNAWNPSSAHTTFSFTLSEAPERSYNIVYVNGSINDTNGILKETTLAHSADLNLVTAASLGCTKTGYHFVNWRIKRSKNGGEWRCTNSSGTALWASASDISSNGYEYVTQPGTKTGLSYHQNCGGTIWLYAQWEANVLTVNYYSNYATTYNGSTATLNAVGSSKNVKVGESKHSYATAYSNGLSNYNSGSTHGMLRTGYTNAAKWGTKADGSGYNVSYSTGFDTGQKLAEALGTSLKTESKSINVYAQWTEHVLTVNFYSNYATEYNGTTASENTISGSVNAKIGSLTYLYDNEYSSGLPNWSGGSTYGMYRTGYTKSDPDDGKRKWGTKTDGSGYNVADDTSFSTGQALAKALGKDLSSGNASVNVYAQWHKQSYTLTVNPNGGYRTSDNATGNTTTTYKYQASGTITKRARDGYYLSSYSLKRTSDNSTSAIGGATVSAIASDGTATFTQGYESVTATAQWSQNYLTVNYYSNYATSYNGTKDFSGTLSASTNVLVWSAKYYYATAYNDGLFNYTASGSTIGMTRTGYTSKSAWNTKSDGSGYNIPMDQAFTTGQALAEAVGKSLKSGNASINLYAQWDPNRLTVNYYSNYATTYNGTAELPSGTTVSGSANVLIGSKTYAYGAEYSSGLDNYDSGNTRGMKKTGYTNARKWGTTTSGGTTATDSQSFATGQALAQHFGKTLVSSPQSINLYAQWTENALTVNYYSNYATSYNGTTTSANTVSGSTNVIVNTQKYYYDDAYPDGLKNYDSGNTLGMLRTGYSCAGEWNTSTNGTGSGVGHDQAFTTGQALAEAFGTTLKTDNASVNVYAQWNPNPYTVSYNANGGTGAPAAQTKYHAQTLKLSSTIPTRVSGVNEYTFTGWNTKADGTGTTYASGANYTANAAVTLYAQWSLDVEKVGVPTVTITDNTDNTVTISCKIGSNSSGNTATGVDLCVYFTDDTGEGKYNIRKELTGSAGSTVSTTISLNMTKAAIASFLGTDYTGNISAKARTLGSASASYYSNFTAISSKAFTWHEPLGAPVITKPAATGETIGRLTSTYTVAWQKVAGGTNNAVSGYSIAVYDETAGKTVQSYTAQSTASSYDIPLSVLTTGHSYTFFVQAKGTYVDGPNTASAALYVENITAFGQIIPRVQVAPTVLTTYIYGPEAIVNSTTDNSLLFTIDWDVPTAINNELDHYKVCVKCGTQNIVNEATIRENKFLVTSDMLANLAAGTQQLEIFVDAQSKYGVNYAHPSSSASAKKVLVDNKASGMYVREAATNAIKKAIAFVRVPSNDGLGKTKWVIARDLYKRNLDGSWTVGKMDSEALYDADGEPILDQDNEQIYTL